MVKFDFLFYEDKPFDLCFHEENHFDVHFEKIVEVEKDVETYDGETVVIPKAHDEQVLNTKNKKVLDNITVKKVPYFETSNEYGTTVYIASGVIF